MVERHGEREDPISRWMRAHPALAVSIVALFVIAGVTFRYLRIG